MKWVQQNKAYQRLLAASFFSNLGDSIYLIALMTFVSEMPHPAVAISIVSLSESLPRILNILTGSIADQSKNSCQKMILAAIIRATMYLTVGVMIEFSASLRLLLAIVLLNFFSDLCGQYSNGLSIRFIRFIVPTDKLEEAQGLSQALAQGTVFFANFAGAVLLGIFSFRFLAWLNSCLFLFTALLYISLLSFFKQLEEENFSDVGELGLKTTILQIRKAIIEIYQEKKLLQIVLLVAILNATLTSVLPLINLLFAENPILVLRSFAFTLAVVQGSLSLAMILGGTFGIKWLGRWSFERLAIVIFIFLLLFSIALAIKNRWLLLSSLSFVGFLVGILSPKLAAEILQQVAPERQATIIGGMNTLGVILIPPATLLYTSVASIFGLFWAAIALIIMSLICLSWSGQLFIRSLLAGKTD